MTVANEQPSILYEADGERKAWTIPFAYLKPDHIRLYLVRTKDGPEEEIITDFSIQGQTLYFPNDTQPPVTAGQKILIRRQTPFVQPIDLKRQQELDPEVFENLLDASVMRAQELSEDLASTVKFSMSATTSETDASAYLQRVELAAANAQAADESAQQSADIAVQAAKDAARETKENAQAAAESAQTAADKASLALAQAGVAAGHAQTAQNYASGDNDYSAKRYAELAQAAFERAGLYFNGPWSADTVYGPNDFVSVETDGRYDFYISLTEGNTAALTDTACWRLFFTVNGNMGGGSGNMRQVVVSGAPLTFTPSSDAVVSNITNAKASNTSNVSAPYASDDYASSEWPSTPLKINAVAGVAWTGQRNLEKKINKIRIRQSQYDGYRITSVKVQIAPDTTPIWSPQESDWIDLGTYALQDAFVFDELVLPDYQIPSNYYAMRILANANGPADEMVKYWAVNTVQMISTVPESITTGPFVGNIAAGFEDGKPKDAVVKLTASKAVPVPESAGTWGVYAGADGTVSAGGVQQGGAEFPDGAEMGRVFFNVQAQKNYVKQTDGWAEYPNLFVGEITTNESGKVISCRSAKKNIQPWALETEQIPALPYLPVSGGTVDGEFTVGSVSPFFKVVRNGNITELYADEKAPKITFLNDFDAVRLQNPQNQNGSLLLAAENKGAADGIGTLNAQGKQPMSEVQGGTVENLDVTGATVTFEKNRTYKAVLSSSVSFTLPVPAAGEENFILVYADITADIGINWGDVLFYNSVPGETLAAGKYEFIFSYDPTVAKWTVGVLPKGAA